MKLAPASNATGGPSLVFLPGIIMPAEFRYAPLVGELGTEVRAFTKELEVYDPDVNAHAYSIDKEVEGLAAAADAAGVDSFYLYGHSAGGAVALAFVDVYPERVLGLGLDEPASDFDAATKASWAKQLGPIAALPENERLPAFMRAQVMPDVELPPPPAGEPPPWMASRPAGMEAFMKAMEQPELGARHGTFRGPVYYSFGSRTNPIWRDIRDRLASAFEDFTAEEYDGLHHVNTSHAAEPARVAASLRRTWGI
jgi:pimeloyl-ACP methyl ester carboxylesterase